MFRSARDWVTDAARSGLKALSWKICLTGDKLHDLDTWLTERLAKPVNLLDRPPASTVTHGNLPDGTAIYRFGSGIITDEPVDKGFTLDDLKGIREKWYDFRFDQDRWHAYLSGGRWKVRKCRPIYWGFNEEGARTYRSFATWQEAYDHAAIMAATGGAHIPVGGVKW